MAHRRAPRKMQAGIGTHAWTTAGLPLARALHSFAGSSQQAPSACLPPGWGARIHHSAKAGTALAKPACRPSAAAVLQGSGPKAAALQGELQGHKL